MNKSKNIYGALGLPIFVHRHWLFCSQQQNQLQYISYCKCQRVGTLEEIPYRKALERIKQILKRLQLSSLRDVRLLTHPKHKSVRNCPRTLITNKTKETIFIVLHG